ncbi:RDD family protein [candidate division WWE3 bacterium]|uniref:RDD family protein n=1 Tax=candidate division WWE3 bacterium TaxID=2053526 RepID=A0A955EC55_UNCKA|nr:RDD family protein [candidate division WWE3 bacterium]
MEQTMQTQEQQSGAQMSSDPVATANTPNTVADTPSSTSLSMPVDLTKVQYASFGSRFLALLIDAVVLGIVGFVVLVLVKLVVTNEFFVNLLSQLIQLVLGLGYTMYFLPRTGATLGKRAMHIMVVDAKTGEYIDLVGVFLREIVGRIVSSLPLALGYLWPLWDAKHQTFHDKIAGTIVIKSPSTNN